MTLPTRLSDLPVLSATGLAGCTELAVVDDWTLSVSVLARRVTELDSSVSFSWSIDCLSEVADESTCCCDSGVSALTRIRSACSKINCVMRASVRTTLLVYLRSCVSC